MIDSYLKSFQGKKILVLGDVFLDEYILGDCSRLSPEAPVPILSVQYSYTVLGGAANTAANIASLGGKACLIGIVGNDRDSVMFKKKARKQGINFIPVTGERPTIKKTRILGQKQQLLRIDYEEISSLPEETEREIFEIYSKNLPGASIVVLSDYAKGFFSKALCETIIKSAHKAGKRVVADPKPSNRAFYRNCDYLTPNWKEALELAGCGPKLLSYESAEEVARKLRAEFKSGVLLTLGPMGVFFLEKNSRESFYLPTHSREVYDVSGAGDTIVAVFALASAGGLPNKEAVRLANRAAGIVVGKMGTATVSPEELGGIDSNGSRVLGRRELAPLSLSLKSQGLVVATVNGSFDLLHNGHLHILKQARMQGDVLIAGLNSDASIRKLKGRGRPLIKEKLRAEMLLALEFVDYVHIFNEQVPMPFLKEIKPHVHVNGSEYGKNCIEGETVVKFGGRIHIVKKIKGFSTTGLLKKISAADARPSRKK